eukprot:GHVR01086789.1.p1 GENE.GHVR01086789.1~~GHVR01086789.1.p1  ORF type:complete len:108 (-),score=33.69 GHVR01086789.1:281-604(-)
MEMIQSAEIIPPVIDDNDDGKIIIDNKMDEYINRYCPKVETNTNYIQIQNNNNTMRTDIPNGSINTSTTTSKVFLVTVVVAVVVLLLAISVAIFVLRRQSELDKHNI